MGFGATLKTQRETAGLSQQMLADELHVTRQTISRWETDKTYPNLDTLVTLAERFQVTVDTLLTGKENKMVEQLSQDVRATKRYRRYFKIGGGILVLVLIWLGVLGYGRANQIDRIDRLNPFLPMKTGYAILPEKIDPPKRGEPRVVDVYVSSDAFGDGEYLKLQTGMYDGKTDVAMVRYKGSYVSRMKPIDRKYVPLELSEHLLTPDGKLSEYFPYQPSLYGNRTGRDTPWWPFS